MNSKRLYRNPGLLAVLAVLLGAVMLKGCGRSGGEVTAEWKLPDEALSDLNDAIANASEYTMQFDRRMDAMIVKLHSLPAAAVAKRYDVAMSLSLAYRAANTDSAIRFSELACRLADQSGDRSRYIGSRLRKVEAMATAGLFRGAGKILDSVASLPLTPHEKIEYWKTDRIYTSYNMSYVQDHKDYYRKARAHYEAIDDSLLAHMGGKTPFYQFVTAERMVAVGRLKEAEDLLRKISSQTKKGDNLYGMAMYQLAEVYKAQGRFTDYAACLAKASESDIMGSIREGMALPALADCLYDRGELSDAFKYVNFALQEAREGNARMRTVGIASLMPGIDAAYQHKINSSRDELMVYVVVVTVLVVLLLVLVMVLRKEIQKSRENAQRVAQVSQLKDSYIGSFITLCSTYAEKLDHMGKLVERKVTAGQSQDLLKLLKSGKFDEGGDEELYKTVDNIFLKLYPDFVKNLNVLLKEEDRFDETPGMPLTPELRIYAFVKLGVTESTKIAQILHYSVSTVYAYRNRMRNRALNRENFDTTVVEQT